MAATNGAHVEACKFVWGTDVDNLHVLVLQARKHLGGRNGNGRVRRKIEPHWRKPSLAGFERQLVVRPAVDAVVVDGDILAAEIADGEMREIGADVAAGRIDDYLARRIDTAAAEDRFDARGFDEIFRGRVTQDT